jgi:2-pyrone-4,6-dicarboxylate lactonase
MAIGNSALPGESGKPSLERSYRLRPSRPKFQVPSGACDTHFHVIMDDPREHWSSLAPAAAQKRAPWSALTQMHETLGIQRGVLIQNTVIARDYGVLIDSLTARPHLRAVALVDDSTTNEDLSRLDQSGVRGARFHFARYMKHHQSSWSVLQTIVDRIAPLSWHVVIHAELDQILEQGELLTSLPVPVVLDNMGNVPFAAGTGNAGFKSLLALQKAPNIWIKLCNFDRSSRVGPPSYADARPFAAALIANDSQRLIWGSDWPHALYRSPQEAGQVPPPDDGALLSFVHDVSPSEAVFRQIVTENPKRLYRFPD